jgi:hypothetical protein
METESMYEQEILIMITLRNPETIHETIQMIDITSSLLGITLSISC